jgi:hypothetical protein
MEPKVHCNFHINSPLVPVLYQISQLHILTHYLSEINVTIILTSTSRSNKWSLSFEFTEEVLSVFLIASCMQNDSPISLTIILPPVKIFSNIQKRPITWPRGLRRRSVAASFLGSRVRIPLGARLLPLCVFMLCCPV